MPRPAGSEIERTPSPATQGTEAFSRPDFDLPGRVMPKVSGREEDQFDVISKAVAPALPPEVPTINLGGMVISGVDINSITKGKFEMKMPLSRGEHALPVDEPGKGHANPLLKVEKNSHMGVDIQFGQNAEGKSVMQSVKGYFSPPVRIKNPASAFQPTGTWGVGGIADSVKDLIADMVIEGFNIGADGKIRVEGTVDKGFIGSDPLVEHVTPEHFPPVNMLLESRLPAHLVAKVGHKDTPSGGTGESGTEEVKPARDLGDMLRRFGAVAGKGNYTLTLDARETGIQAEHEKLKLWTPEGPVKISVKGHATLLRTGSMDFETEPESGFTTPALGLRTGVSAHVTRPARGQTAAIDLRVSGDLGKLSSHLMPDDTVTVPVHFDKDKNHFEADAHVDVDQHRKIAARAKVRADAMLGIAEDPDSARTQMGAFQFSSGDLKAGVSANVVYGREGVEIHGSTAKLTFEGVKPRVEYDGFHTRGKGSFGTEVILRNVAYRAGDGLPILEGESKVVLRPSAELLREFPDFAVFERTAQFSLGKDGQASLKMQGGADISSLMTSVVNLEGNPDAIVSMDTPAFGVLGSDAYREGIAQLMVDPGKRMAGGVRPVQIRAGNHVEWLIDGKESRPKRLELIDNAKESLCMQTLIFKADETGMETARHLAEAAKRGVQVRVIVDSLGNMEKIEDLVHEHPAYETMVEAGVQLQLYNDGGETGLRTLVEVLRDNPDLTVDLSDMTDITNPAKAIRIFHKLSMIAQNRIANSMNAEAREKLQNALGLVLGAENGQDAARVVGEIAEYTKDGIMEVDELIGTVRRLANLNHRWHEKYLIADGCKSITGGINIADEYLLGGELDGDGIPIEVTALGVKRPAWRDTDIFIEGAAAYDDFQNFADNWEYVTQKDGRAERIKTAADPDVMVSGGIDVMSVQHRPHVDGDHNIVNFFVESLKAMEPGQKAIFANAYFIPTGSLTRYKEAMIDAAKRGVDVQVLTNSGTTSDMPQLNQAAVFPYRELLEGGVKIFERTGNRTMHQKCFSMGGEVAGAMSWNGDNRSGALNSEHMSVVFDPKLAMKLQLQLEEDMHPRHCKQVMLEDVARLPWKQELEAAGLAWFSNLM